MTWHTATRSYPRPCGDPPLEPSREPEPEEQCCLCREWTTDCRHGVCAECRKEDDLRDQDSMTNPIEITVTAEDIAEGVRNSCSRCPVARAGERHFGGLVTVGRSGLRNYSDDRSYMLPKVAQEFIRDFDAGRPVAPFTFRLE